jgi:hypothetical protein
MAYPTITERPGSLSATVVAKETVFGTPVAGTTTLPETGNTMAVDPGWFSPELMMNTRDLHVFNLYGEQTQLGTLSAPFFPTNAATLMVGSIGADAVTGSANPYTHTISQANTLPSYTIEQNIGGFQSLQYAGCRIGKMSLTAAATNEPINVAYDMVGQSVAILTSPTAVSVTNELPFVFAEGTVTLFGQARVDVSSIKIDIDNGIKTTYTFDQEHGPGFITPCTLHVSGTVTVVWSSLNNGTYGDYTTMINETLGSLSFVMTHPGGTGASLTITCPQVVYSKYTPDIKMQDVVMSNLTFEATKSLSSGYTVQAILLNSVSTGY